MARNYVLIVEDTLSLALTYEACLLQENYKVRIASTGEEALKIIAESRPLAILLDLKLPDIDGMEVLKIIRQQDISAAILVITGQTSLNIAVEAMKYGADDFVSKPIDPERLQISVANAIEKKRMQQVIVSLEEVSRTHFGGFIGGSPEMLAVYRVIESAAKSHAAVMITGESGTGKEIAAQAVHSMSERKEKELVALNCAAIPHDLLESEIFGHIRGAFTGATINREGAASRADGGTLFLDELTEMPLALQSKLLRFIQTGIFTPVGSNKAVQSDIRFICATNRDPIAAIQQGSLREDLYYRLAVIPINMPSLRYRGNDIIMLSEHFLRQASRKEGKKFKGISNEAADILLKYKWPGNVRELENIIRQCVIMNSGELLTADMLAMLQDRSRAGGSAPVIQKISDIRFQSPADILPMEEIEKRAILSAIDVCQGNITEAAKRLDINPSTIHRKQKQWQGN